MPWWLEPQTERHFIQIQSRGIGQSSHTVCKSEHFLTLWGVYKWKRWSFLSAQSYCACCCNRMISWLCTVWNIHPPLVNFISLSLGAGAQQPGMHSLWVEVRRIRERPMCTAVHLEAALLWGLKERICLDIWPYAFWHSLSIKLDITDGVMDSIMCFARMPSSDTKQKNKNTASALLSLKTIWTFQVMWQCTKLHWQPRQNSCWLLNGLTNVYISIFGLVWQRVPTLKARLGICECTFASW